MDDIIKICDELEEDKLMDRELKVVRARKRIKKYIDKDYNKLLQLKAEVKMHSNFDDSVLKMLSFFMSAIALILTIINNFGNKALYIDFVFGYGGPFIFILMIVTVYNKKNSARSKWLIYIEIVLDDIEKEYKNEDNKSLLTPKNASVYKQKVKKNRKKRR